MERFVRLCSRLTRIRTGPLGQYIELFVQELSDQGYSADAIGNKIRLMDGFGVWLKSKKLTAADVDVAQINKYLRQRKQCPRHIDRPTLMRLLHILIQNGVVPHPSEPSAPAAVLADEYATYLEIERALALRSIPIYKSWARRFLEAQFGDGEIEFAALNPSKVIEFVKLQTGRIGQKACKLMTTVLRSFFQFLRYREYISLDLAATVPAVASWTMTTIPKALPSDQLESLLRACKRESATGRRDYAIILLMARLGLRPGEVAFLTLNDIDWELGYITVRDKGGQLAKLPLPIEVGEALVDYLQNGRPKTSIRKFFLSAQAPIHGFSCNRRISMLVGEALEKAGIDSQRKGAHQLRHSLATGMLQRGASLREIGEVLRHRDLQSSAIYAKVDLKSLREVAMPWPGGIR
ncbi:MAG: site-specific integrase [Candidatus Obscuribacterales bacterium]|nr:site-specific integrase [Candidatus Obscuribacterales bacterium]